MLVETAGERILLPGGELRWWPAFLSPERAGCAFRALRRRAHWERSRIRIAGRWLEAPRLNAWYGEPGREYGYSGTRLVRRPFFPALAWLRARVEEATGECFDCALLNLYRDERDSVDWHADDERELGPEPVVAALSLGETRRFELRRKDNHRVRFALELPSGSLLLMAGALQRHWQHRVPKERHPCGERISVTFRRHWRSRA